MKDIYIFDNFYSDPYSVREFALNCNYDLTAPVAWAHNTENVLWPGYVTNSTHKVKDIDVKVSKLLGVGYRSDKQSGFFRLNQVGDTSPYYVHTDGLPVENKINYTGVVYLSLPSDCVDKSGTIFYKHIRTGRTKLECIADYNQTLLDTKNKDAWCVDNIVEIKFNRLILLNQTLFHSIGDTFGNTKENGRLAQIFNFYQI
jgi:hypothetical protein